MIKDNLVIIPARGNSKRLPNKNILPIGNIPLIAHSIQYAKQHCPNARLIVSTDSEKIKNVALDFGVEVINRPVELSGDLCTTVSALKHVLLTLNQKFDNVILLQPTNPLRPEKLLKEAYKKFKDGNYDSLMTVTRDEKKLGRIVDDQFIPYNYEIGQRSQDLEPLYYENGLLYITKADLILKDKIVGDNNFSFIINHPFAKVDIDTLEDFEYAEYMFKRHFE